MLIAQVNCQLLGAGLSGAYSSLHVLTSPSFALTHLALAICSAPRSPPYQRAAVGICSVPSAGAPGRAGAAQAMQERAEDFIK